MVCKTQVLVTLYVEHGRIESVYLVPRNIQFASAKLSEGDKQVPRSLVATTPNTTSINSVYKVWYRCSVRATGGGNALAWCFANLHLRGFIRQQTTDLNENEGQSTHATVKVGPWFPGGALLLTQILSQRRNPMTKSMP